MVDGGLALLEEDGQVEPLFQAVVLRLGAEATHFGAGHRRVEKLGEVDALGLPVIDGVTRFEGVGAADHLVERAETELSHDLTDFLGDEAHEVHGVFGTAGEVLTELRVLGGDADRAGIEVTDAHHDAAEGHQRARGEAELFGAEEGGDDDVTAGLQLAVGLDDDAGAEVVEDEGLVGLGEAEFPRQAGVLDGGLGRSARAAVEAGDEDDVRVRLGHARGDGADADFRHELHTDARGAVGVLQVMDEFRKVLDRVDVVVRGRGDEADAGGRVTDLGDRRVDLAAGELTAFAGLGALGHLDLDFLGVGQVAARDAEAAGSDLLDGGVLGVALFVGPSEACGVFAAFAGVGLAADAVHRDREGFVGFGGDGAVAHRARLEALQDVLDGLDLVDVDRRAGLELQQAA